MPDFADVVSQSIPPAAVDLYADQGSDFTINIRLKDSAGNARNIAGQSFRGQFRRHYASSNTNSITVSVANANTAEIQLSITGNLSQNVLVGRYVYDVEMFTANTVSRVLEGVLTITPEVTR